MAQYELKLINDINIIHVNTDWINMKSKKKIYSYNVEECS